MRVPSEGQSYIAVPASVAEKAVYKAHAKRHGVTVAAFARQAMDEHLSPEDRAMVQRARGASPCE